jgi:hypothetical protein
MRWRMVRARGFCEASRGLHPLQFVTQAIVRPRQALLDHRVLATDDCDTFGLGELDSL